MGQRGLLGGVLRLSGYAVSSLGDALENNGNPQEINSLRLASSGELPPDKGASETRLRKRQVAGSSVRLIGESIDQIADSLLLVGSATERVAFAAAGAAEGTVRVVEGLTRSLLNELSAWIYSITVIRPLFKFSACNIKFVSTIWINVWPWRRCSSSNGMFMYKINNIFSLDHYKIVCSLSMTKTTTYLLSIIGFIGSLPAIHTTLKSR